MKIKAICFSLVVAMASWAVADTITVDGVTHEGVYVREGGSLYYVQFPENGEVMTVRKGSSDATVAFANDPEYREALRLQWRAAFAERNPERMQVENAPSAYDLRMAEAAAGNPAQEEPRVFQLRGDATAYARAMQQQYAQMQGQVTDGYVPYINLRDVPLGDALKALLRQQNLDYTVHNNILYVSSADTLRREAWEQVETRYHQLSNAGTDTMPKIVLRHPQLGGMGGMGMGGFGGGGMGMGGMGGGMGMGGMGGGMGMGGMGMGGMGGGMGGMGGGMGMGGMGGGMDVTGISNISDLFSNIDDRIVGEPPAQIGLGIVSATPRRADRGAPQVNAGQMGAAQGGMGGGMMGLR